MTESKFKLDNMNNLSQEGTTISGEKHDGNEISKVVQDNSQHPSQQLETGILNDSNFKGNMVHGEKDSDNEISKNGREKYDGWKRFYLLNSVSKVGKMQRSRLLASKTVLLDNCGQDLCSFPRRKKLGKF